MAVDTVKEFGTGPAAEVRRWLKELDLADKTEKDWRVIGEKIWDVYRGTKRRKNSFNILWSNTETLAPALFNTPPSPDVRRRFRDEDPVGKAVAQLLERCLEFQTDTEGFMHSVKQDVLDAILPGRGVSRVKYVPEFAPAPAAEPAQEEGQEAAEITATPDGEPVEPEEVLAFEQCQIEHVQWDDFRHGPGKTWREVQWVAFRHRMSKDEITDLAGEEVAKGITFDNCQDDQIDKDTELKTVFGTVEVWEFWCKEYRQVQYMSKAYTKAPLKTIDDPLKLIDFFPNPRPLYAIQDSSTLIPTALFEQYREQANELDALSGRINRIVNALKIRGVYDSTVTEMGQLMTADDNKLIPTQNAAMWLDKGGLEKSIYWMPIEQAAMVLKELYASRDAAKQVIYELSGIADVRRGTSDPGETLGAQKLKADFGNQRISGLKLEVERYVRDLMRLMSELIAEKFQPESLLRMSQMQIPTEQEIQQKVQQTQMQAAQQAQQTPPQPGVDPGQATQQAVMQAMQQLGPKPISLEQVMAVLKDDATRMFKIDVETDSMISATINDDMQGLQAVLGGIVQFIDGVGPAVQAGAFPVEAVKEIVMTICRRSKMGSAVEDALDKIQAPQQQANPEQAKAQAAGQAAQVKAQSDQAIAAQKAQSDAAVAQSKAESDARVAQMEAHFQQQTDISRQNAEAQQHQAKVDSEAQLALLEQKMNERIKTMEMQFDQWKVTKQVEGQITVAEIAANATLSAAQETAADTAAGD